MRGRWRWLHVGLAAALLLAWLLPTAACATTPAEVAALPTLDALNRVEDPLSNSGKWTALAWDSSASTHKTGSVQAEGWSPFDEFPGVNGAYWNAATFSDSSGEAASVTMAVGPSPAERYGALWLDLTNPGAAQSGYQLRWTSATGGYTVELAKWTAGTKTGLATETPVTIAAGTTLALSDSGGTVQAWKSSGGALTSFVSASDATYSSGYAGLEGSGPNSRLSTFKAGNLVPPPDTSILSGPTGLTVPSATFSFSGSAGTTGFECSLGGGAFETCASPKTFGGLAEGAHAVRMRAVNASGPDATPAERGFQSVTAAKAVAKVPILDNFERAENPLATGKFTKTSWAASLGGAWMGSYRGYGSSGGLAGAYWNPGTFSDGEGSNLVIGTVGTGATPAGQYLGLWLDMPSPGTVRSGYEARFTGTGSTTYTAEIAKWVSGTRTVLASATGVSLPVGTTMALSETSGGGIVLWTGTSSLTQLLAAVDSTYTSGYAGIEVNGGAGTINNFRAGPIDLQAPETTITGGPSGAVLPSAVSFTFSSSEPNSTFECVLDGGTYSACTSPKSYTGLAVGGHTFGVRAVDAVGNQDGTPAQRSFEVIGPPAATTNPATALDSTKATLNGTVNPNGAATTYQFEYGTSTAYGSKVPAAAEAVGSGKAGVAVSKTIEGLTADTTYHYRVVATNGAGTTTSADATFTTPTLPVATTEAATAVTGTEATLKATVNPKNSPTTYQFEYGPTTAYGSTAPATKESVGGGGSGVAVTKTITGLAGGTTYHFRVVAQNAIGTTYGQDLTFQTMVLPEATTMAATGVASEEAAFNGEVDPNGNETTYYFQYGETAAYGAKTPLLGEEVGSGTSPVEVMVAPELEPETTYHYRLVAVNQAGTKTGQDMTTTTAARVAPGERPGDFVNLNWDSWEREENPAHMKVIQKSGAKLLRLGMLIGEQNWTVYETIFCNAAKDGITILPYVTAGNLPTSDGPLENWKSFVRGAVTRFGPGGTLWQTCPNVHPARVWEIYNEENFFESNENPDPAAFAKLYEETAQLIQNNGGGAENVKTMIGGLLSFRTKNSQHMRTGEYFAAVRNHVQNKNLIDAVALHPYEFAPLPGTGEPSKVEQERESDIVTRMGSDISEVHQVDPNLPIWITEFGWPVEYSSPGHPAVSKAAQGRLIEKAIEMMEKRSGSLHIENVFFFCDHDELPVSQWFHHTGLQEYPKRMRKPAWQAFVAAAHGDQNYPLPPKVKTKGHGIGSRQIALLGSVDPLDMESFVGFQYGPTTSYGSSTPFTSAGWEAGEKEVSKEITGLSPETTYHYRIAAYNENEEWSYGEDQQFTTGACPTETFLSNGGTVNGEPGYVTLTGHVNSVAADCGAVDGQYVNVNYYKQNGAGQYVYDSTDQPIVHNGAYSETNRPVGIGNWMVQTVFPAQGIFKGSSSPWPGPGFSIVPNGWHVDNLGGSFTGDPGISSQGAGRLDVFGPGIGHDLYINTFPVGSVWGGWVPLGGQNVNGVDSVSWGSGRIDLVYNESGYLRHWYWTGSAWGSDTLGEGITGDPAISSWGPNRLDVFARDTNGNLLHKYWGGAGWSGWEYMGGGLAGGPSAVSWGGNRIDVVARMADETIGHWWWGGFGWNYDNLGGKLSSDPSISSQGPERLDVFARDQSTGMSHRWFAPVIGWSNWEPMGGAIIGGPDSVSWSLNRVDVVAQNWNHTMVHWWYSP